ncbi:glycosyltransferase [Actinoplanes sp. TRM 88003]|uniref:Glycosyltransferase n=1 Tax=Paractinoplanes aksuensis TaxID=2939490 RepID=A0ABT1DLQ9_9ACTN|nr:glycosyltransferase [Actinoplanes aksuensis]MCO8271779.1 glycosyltransferase [Actinoplanes aksuensis]
MSSQSPMISLVLPAYNESASLPVTISRLARQLNELVEDYEIIIVDDGSSDGGRPTFAEAEIRMIRHPVRMGKGAALRSGIKECAGRYIAYTDADLPIDPSSIALAIGVAQQNPSALVLGDRRHPQSVTVGRGPASRRLTSWLFSVFTRATVLPDLRDTQCCLKVASSARLKPIAASVATDGYSFDVELIYLAKKAGMTIVASPVVWRDIRADLGLMRAFRLLGLMIGDVWRTARRHDTLRSLIAARFRPA